MSGELEVDESYFGTQSVCGKRGLKRHLCFYFVLCVLQLCEKVC
nr:hypothetical protein [Campylobacter troglodytis]